MIRPRHGSHYWVRPLNKALDVMEVSVQLQQATAQLVEQIVQDVEVDTSLGPSWMAAEGGRVLGLARQLSAQSSENARVDALVQGDVISYLGRGWLECHSKAYDRAQLLQSVLDNAV